MKTICLTLDEYESAEDCLNNNAHALGVNIISRQRSLVKFVFEDESKADMFFDIARCYAKNIGIIER